MKKNNKKTGFTLIELLVVIAIIAMLAALLFPAISSSFRTAKNTQAQNTAQMIENAIMIYKNEYNGKLPVETYGSDDDISQSDSVSKEIIEVLMNIGPGNANNPLNHKGIVFLEADTAFDDGTFPDPWGNQYKILLDRNLDGRISYLTDAGQDHRKTAVVVSAGRDEDFQQTKDNQANVDLPNR